MLAWLFERKTLSPVISDPSTFLRKQKLAIQNFIFTGSMKYKLTYTTFLTAEDKQI